MLREAKESAAQSWRGRGEGSFPGKEVALGLLGLTWKDEEAEGVGWGCHSWPSVQRVRRLGSVKQHVQPVGLAGDSG